MRRNNGCPLPTDCLSLCSVLEKNIHELPAPKGVQVGSFFYSFVYIEKVKYVEKQT